MRKVSPTLWWCLVGAVFVLIGYHWSWFSESVSHFQPEWVQAIGTIAALFIAVGVAFVQNRHAEQLNERRHCQSLEMYGRQQEEEQRRRREQEQQKALSEAAERAKFFRLGAELLCGARHEMEAFLMYCPDYGAMRRKWVTESGPAVTDIWQELDKLPAQDLPVQEFLTSILAAKRCINTFAVRANKFTKKQPLDVRDQVDTEDFVGLAQELDTLERSMRRLLR